MTDLNTGVRRRTIITGAGRGLGREMALGLLGAGYAVLIVDRDREPIEETLALAHERGCGEHAFDAGVDLTSPDAVATVMRAAEEKMGGVDVLVNNAGVGPSLVRKDYFENPPSFDEVPDDMVRLFFEINGIAPLLLSMHAARSMRARKWGRIVNVTTSYDSMMRRGFAPYGGTKASLESHSAIMAPGLAGTGITGNIPVPGGPADTNMIPQEAGFDRSQLVSPAAMVEPLKWLLADVAEPPNGKRVLAAIWTPDSLSSGHPSVSLAGWQNTGSKAIFPASKR